MLKIGHRGACGYLPENTIKSIKKAIDLKVDIIEIDVQTCKTGEVVVIHDDTVDRTTNSTGYIYEKSLKELKKLDLGQGERIPTLEEALDAINKRAIVIIELKDKKSSARINEIIKGYIKRKGWSYDYFIVTSFLENEVKRFRKINRKIRISLGITWYWPFSIEQRVKAIGAEIVEIYYRIVTRRMIKRLHEAGIKIFVYTVNDEKEISKMKNLEVDGIYSDFPDRIK